MSSSLPPTPEVFLDGIPKEGATASLVQRISLGDRDALAEFITTNRSLIQHRFRRKLGKSLRRLVESSDIVGSISRRLDQLMVKGAITARSEGELWALIVRVGNRAVADQARLLARLRRAETEDRAWAQAAIEIACPNGNADVASVQGMLDVAFDSLTSAIDRTILAQWLSGTTHAVIAQGLGMETANVRKRWERIRERLQENLS